MGLFIIYYMGWSHDYRERQIKSKDDELSLMKDYIKLFEEDVVLKAQRIEELRNPKPCTKCEEHKRCHLTIEELEQDKDTLSQTIAKKNEEIADLNEQINQLNEKMKQMSDDVATTESKINSGSAAFLQAANETKATLQNELDKII
jgi:methyl-accepting chemotaxis protein